MVQHNSQHLTPQENGRQFEKEFADSLGAKLVKGSGNQWFAKLDVSSAHILWSLKSTSKKSLPFTSALMQEAEAAILGSGGVGGETVPGVATSVDGEVYVTLKQADFIRLFQSDVKFIEPSNSEKKRQRSKLPELFRSTVPDE